MGLPAWALVATTVASTAATAYGAIQQGKSEAAASKYNAAVAAENSRQAQETSRQLAEKGNIETMEKQQENRAKIGAMVADQGASGVDVSGGSFAGVRESAEEIGRMSVNDIRTSASREAYGYQEQAANYTSQSNMLNSQAKQQRQAGFTKAFTTILGNASNINDSWNNYMNTKSLSGMKSIKWNDGSKSIYWQGA